MTILIAVIVAFIALQQFLLARERFKLDLFEQRFSIFKATATFINDAIRDHKISWECLQKFDKDTETASFLFNQDIVSFLADLRTKANIVTAYHNEHKELEAGSTQRHEIVEKESKILLGFIDIQNGLKNRFSPYLKFSNWKYGFLLGNIKN
jgi:hypothetical protein